MVVGSLSAGAREGVSFCGVGSAAGLCSARRLKERFLCERADLEVMRELFSSASFLKKLDGAGGDGAKWRWGMWRKRCRVRCRGGDVAMSYCASGA